LIEFAEVRVDGNCPESYVLRRTWTATDNCGNSSSQTQVLTVVDTQAPVLSGVPGDATVQCDAVPAPGAPTASDNCDAEPLIEYAEVRVDGQCPDSYTLRRTWTATDNCGNSSSQTQLLTVVDTQAPVLSGVPSDATVQCDAVPAPGAPTASDNCDAEPLIEFAEVRVDGNCPESYVLRRTWTATDNCGNSSSQTQVLTVVDTEAPVLSGVPADATVECDAVSQPASPTASDNCNAEPLIEFAEARVDGQCPESYVLRRTWTATDNCGNSSSQTQVLTVVDTQAPELSGVPADATVQCDAVPAPETVRATDNCDADVPVLFDEQRTDGSCTGSYTLTRRWTATDDCGNTASHTQVVTVVDETPPVFTFFVPLDTVQCGTELRFVPPTVTDNCDPNPIVTMLSVEATPGVFIGESTFVATFVAEDACGNVSEYCLETIFQPACTDGNGCSFTMGGWGSKCPKPQQGDMESTQPGCVRDHYFDQVFPDGVLIGDPAGNYAKWTSALAVENYLPAGSTPGVLTGPLTDPTTTPAGVLAGQILTLKLNTAFSCAGVFADLGIADPGFCYGAYMIPAGGGKFAGLTVNQFLAIADSAVAGHLGVLAAYGATLPDVNRAATTMNELFDGCDPLAPKISLLEIQQAGLLLGDVNKDGRVSASDIIYLANYVYKGGPEPLPYVEIGDFLWDYKVVSSDVVKLVDYVLRGGSPTQ
jgi:FlaG/FlaF family flagellin (archaellin)